MQGIEVSPTKVLASFLLCPETISYLSSFFLTIIGSNTPLSLIDSSNLDNSSFFNTLTG